VRIFDTFPFDGELDLLQFHLEETFDLVDAFVLVEAAETYRGAAKPFTYADNADRFAWAAGKIRHVKLSGLGRGPTARDRAAVQREAAMLALSDALPDDVALLLDVDEVPSRSLLEHLRAEGLDRPRRLAMSRHYGFADTLGPRSSCCPTGADPFAAATPWLKPAGWDGADACWYGHSGVAAPCRTLAAGSAFRLRYGLPLGEPIADAGRHFSGVDPSAALRRKLSRLFHEEFDGLRERSPEHLDLCRRHWVHHRGWWYAERPPGPLPDDVERLVRACPETGAGSPPPPLARRLVRSWAWLRLWRRLPDRIVASVDRNFERWRPLLAPPLLLLDAGRAAAAAVLRLAGRRAPAPAAPHH
jgi:beta-1,4-mannosyl-glycoprotein beta-1,4-N-acetylglucosaminyltransferase